MFCPSCGKSEQTPDSYCRSCGEFLSDYSAKSFFVNKLLGGANPRTQVKYGLALNAVTFFISAFLLGFLNGHYDALYDRTGEAPPNVIYYVYVFLGLVITWQLLGFFVNRRLLKKLDRGKQGARDGGPTDKESELPSRRTQRNLPQGRVDDFVNSATEHTTRSLEEVPRRRSTSQDLQ